MKGRNSYIATAAHGNSSGILAHFKHYLDSTCNQRSVYSNHSDYWYYYLSDQVETNRTGDAGAED